MYYIGKIEKFLPQGYNNVRSSLYLYQYKTMKKIYGILTTLATLLGIALLYFNPTAFSGPWIFPWLVLSYYVTQLGCTALLMKSDIFTTSPLDSIRERITQPHLGWKSRRFSMTTPPGHTGTGHESLWTSNHKPSLRLRLGTRLKLRSPNDFLENLLVANLLVFFFSWIIETGDTNGLYGFLLSTIRFGPLFLLNGFAYLTYRITPGILPRLWKHRKLYDLSYPRPKGVLSLALYKVFRGVTWFFRLIIRVLQLPRPDHTRIESWLVRISRSYSLEITGLRTTWLFVCSYRLPLTILSAVLVYLAFPNWLVIHGIGILGWFALIPLFLVLKTSSFTQTLYYLTVFGLFQAIFLFHWQGFQDPGILARHVLFTTGIFFAYGLVLGTIRNIVFTPAILGRFDWLLWPLSWTMFDYLKSLSSSQVTWAFLGETQYEFHHIVQLAELSGMWGIGFLVMLSSSVLAHIFLPYPTRKTPWNNVDSKYSSMNSLYLLAIPTILILLALIFGQTSLDRNSKAYTELTQFDIPLGNTAIILSWNDLADSYRVRSVLRDISDSQFAIVHIPHRVDSFHARFGRIPLVFRSVENRIPFILSYETPEIDYISALGQPTTGLHLHDMQWTSMIYQKQGNNFIFFTAFMFFATLFYALIRAPEYPSEDKELTPMK